MSIDAVVASCLIRGTSFSEKAKSVAIRKRTDEIVMAFRTDSPEFRGITNVQRASDVAFLYMRHLGRPVLLFVELKGSDISHAADQLQATIEAVRKLIRNTVHSSYPECSDVRAIIVRSGSAPANQTLIQERFYKATGVRLRFARDKADLRDFVNS